MTLVERVECATLSAVALLWLLLYALCIFLFKHKANRLCMW